MSRPTGALWGFPRVLAVIALGAVACGGDDGSSTLVTLDEEPAGESCPEGGVIVRVGNDEDGDGELSGDEVTSSELLCHGSTSSDDAGGTLVRTTELGRGDEACPFGGVRIEAGLDDGAGGGTAGDGELQAGEIDDVVVICNGVPGQLFGDLVPPAGPAGQYRIDLSGGDGTACGGDGGNVNLSSPGGLNGGHVKIFPTGQADASFTLPAGGTRLGARPLEITTDTTLEVFSDADCDGQPDDTSGLSAGDVYQIDCTGGTDDDEARLWMWNGTEGRAATGLRVAPGATLTLTLIDGQANVMVSDDILLEGVLTTVEPETGGRQVWLSVASFVSTAGARVDLAADAGERARFGVNTSGAFLNRAAIDVSGGDGAEAIVFANNSLWNTGDIDGFGGTHPDTGRGGVGGQVLLFSSSGSIFNSGAFDVRGGDGAGDEGDGGEGGFVLMTGRHDVVNGGALDVSGGKGSTTCADTTCHGGKAGFAPGDAAAVWFQAGERIRHDADIVARGGDGGDGGGGGRVMFESGSGSLGLLATPARALAGIEVSGNFDLRGGRGTGGNGGWGGELLAASFADGGEGGGPIQIAGAAPHSPRPPAEIVFYGYTGLDLDGGDSADTCGGGDGGEAFLDNSCPWSGGPAGGVALLTDLSAVGGESTGGGDGGEGGSAMLFTCTAPFVSHAGVTVALLEGSLALGGGDSAEGEGGDGGEALLVAFEAIESRADVDISGGNGAEGGGWGGEFMAYASKGHLLQSGNVDGRGGRGVGNGASAFGGHGGYIELEGLTVDSAGDLRVDGGAGAAGGGDGGEISLWSYGGSTSRSGTLSAAGGASTSPGEPGLIVIDGFDATP